MRRDIDIGSAQFHYYSKSHIMRGLRKIEWTDHQTLILLLSGILQKGSPSKWHLAVTRPRLSVSRLGPFFRGFIALPEGPTQPQYVTSAFSGGWVYGRQVNLNQLSLL